MILLRNRWGMWLRAQGIASASEPETVAYLTFMGIPDDATVYYPSTPQQITGSQLWAAVNNYVLALKAANIAGVNWTNAGTATCIMLRDNLFIGGTAARHSYNLADPTKNLAFFGSWVHNALGIIGNGANTYANDGLRPSDLSSLVAMYHGYVLQDGGNAASGGMWVGGCRTAPGSQELSHLRITNTFYGCPNTGISSGNQYTTSSTINFTGDFAQLRRNQAGANTFQYTNGVQTQSSANGNTPIDLGLDMYVGALNQNGNLVNPYQGGIQHAFFSNELTPTQHSAWFAGRNALQVALNRVPVP